MKNFEKYALASLTGALFFSVFNIQIYPAAAVLLVTVFMCFANKRYLYFLFFGIIVFIGGVISFAGEPHIGSSYKMNIRVDKKIEIKSINSRMLKNRYYLENRYLENRTGSFSARVKIKDIKKINGNYYIDGELLDLKEGNLNRYRDFVRKTVENTGYSYEVESFVKAIVLGERAELSEELEENYRKVGASHVLSVSGLHISIVIVVFLTIFHYFSFGYRMKYGLTLAILTFYIAMLGNNPAVIRSYIMGFIYLLSKIFYEKADVKKSFCLSIIISIFLNPNVIKDLSFMMSYSALFGIIYVYEKFKKENIYYNVFILSLIVQLVLTPVTVYYFKTLALYTFIFNVFIVVWGDLLINLIFIGVFLEGIKLGFITRAVTEFFYNVLDLFIKAMGKLPHSSMELEKYISVYFFAAMLILIAFVFYDAKYSFYGVMALVLIYNFLPYENLIRNNFCYFPKEKTLVLLSDKKDKLLEKYTGKASFFIGEGKSLEKMPKGKTFELKKGETLRRGKLTIEYMEKINCRYD